MTPALAVLDAAADPRAHTLARRLGVPCVAAADSSIELVLAYAGDRLEARWNRPAAPRPVAIDFVAGNSARRWRGPLSRRRAIARAVGLEPGRHVRVLDATAGLGRDAFLLASYGCEVIAVERSPVIAALLEDGLARARAAALPAHAAARMRVVCADARTVIAELVGAEAPDVIYLDPMLAPGRSTALAKREMQLLQALVGPDGDAAELLALARRHARRRTVVKRPRRAQPLAPDVGARIAEARVRWDVYLAPRTDGAAG